MFAFEDFPAGRIIPLTEVVVDWAWSLVFRFVCTGIFSTRG